MMMMMPPSNLTIELKDVRLYSFSIASVMVIQIMGCVSFRLHHLTIVEKRVRVRVEFKAQSSWQAV